MYKILDSNQTLTEINVSFSKLPGSCSSLWWDQSEKKNAEKKKMSWTGAPGWPSQ